MDNTISDDVLRDDLALSLASAIAAANRQARDHGIDVGRSFLTITQNFTNGSHWRVNYGPKNAVGRRGGDLIVEINAANGKVTQVFYGQ